jgi:hypothetical protein
MMETVELVRLGRFCSRCRDVVGKNKRFLPIGNRSIKDVEHKLIKDLAREVFLNVGKVQLVTEIPVKGKGPVFKAH